MADTITSKTEFETKIKSEKKDQLLIFHSENSNKIRINRYKIIALETAVENDEIIEAYTINLDIVNLEEENKEAYQCGNQVICCTTIKKGVVMDKKVNPLDVTLKQMIRDIFV